MSSPPLTIESGTWLLDPSIAYLNHGSFGARTDEIYKRQLQFKQNFEADPITFLDRDRHEMLQNARHVVSEFVGADPKGLGFVENATTAIGCAIRSVPLTRGDEILTTNHVYNGVRQLLKHHATQQECSFREIDVQLPIQSQADILTAIQSECSKKTRCLVIDHIASASSLIFPVKEIIKFCRQMGIFVLVDGAHAPGMVPLDISSLKPDWYVANLHKWVCAPLGAAFIWTDEQHRSTTHPMTVSHWLHQGYTNEFDWQGTRDISPWLTAPYAVRAGSEIGWDSIYTHNHAMATWMHKTLVEAFNVDPLLPLDGSLFGSMATVRLPEGFPTDLEECNVLRDKIYHTYQVEVPIFEFQGQSVLRVSAQLYSTENDVFRLIRAIQSISNNLML